MFLVKFDNKELNKILGNTVSYSQGFFDGIELERLSFNRFLGGFTAEALSKYIDMKAKSNPNSLHHVYEWGMTGKENGRLFSFKVNATKTSISIDGSFLKSKKPSPDTTDIFYDKANIMENGISITIEPKQSSVLVFEDNGETVFTTKSIFIEHPGGDEVAGSFGSAVDSFFSQYFTNALLRPVIMDLQNADEFRRNFKSGARGGGRPVGVRAGREYFRLSGVNIE